MDWRLSAGTENVRVEPALQCRRISLADIDSERQMTSSEPKDRAPVRGPSARLIGGLLVTLGLILAFCLYTVHEIGQLREEQTRISERNRLDSLQLLRIQNNLSTIATAMRDMADRTEPYPMVSWRQTFDRVKADLEQAIRSERALAPAERPAAQQRRLVTSLERFWSLVDTAFTQAVWPSRVWSMAPSSWGQRSAWAALRSLALRARRATAPRSSRTCVSTAS